MWDHFVAILWAQSRITRNHFSRTTVGTALSWTLSTLWYGLFVFLALVTALAIANSPFPRVQTWLPVGLLSLFLYMQIVPLVTLSSGWSLQLNKLQIYPVSDRSLFAIEVLLRFTSAPEMIIMLLGAMVGLMRRPEVFPLAPLWMLLFIPFNLFLQLAIRDLLLHMFARNRFRELLMIFVVCIALVPQMLLRTHSIRVIRPYLITISSYPAAPWQQVSSLSLGTLHFATALFLISWVVFAAGFAFWQFSKSKIQDEGFVVATPATRPLFKLSFGIMDRVAYFFRDPMGAIIEKELRSLVRMPRFRVLFGMACIFSVLVFFPIGMRDGLHMSNDFMPVISLYGLLLLSDALLLNIFGFDRGAAQLYFLAPLPLATVIKAKNSVAVLFVTLQTIAIPLVAMLFRLHITLPAALTGFCASAVATVYLLSAGNLMSATIPRPIDPGSTFRRQAGAKVQMWLLACSLGMAILVGFAYLARWATDRNWVLLAVLLLEFVVGLIVYKISLDSSVERALKNQEAIVAALSKNAAPVSAG